MNEKLYSKIKSHSSINKEEECCGLILDNDIVECDNKALIKKNNFAISGYDFEKAQKLGNIVGFYHSHPNDEEISNEDKYAAEKTKLPCIVYRVKSDKFTQYNPTGLEIPYLNRPYIHAYLDCFALVKDYYLRELNINIPELTHKYRLIEDKESLIDLVDGKNIDLLSFFLENGFKTTQTFKKHNILLLKSNTIKSCIHCLIYLGDGKILHHPHNRKSIITSYNDFYKKRTLYNIYM